MGPVRTQPIQIFPLPGLPEIAPGDDLAGLIIEAAKVEGFSIKADDVLVVAQKVVSKAEGRIVRLDTVSPSPRAMVWAEEWAKDARVVELVLRESKSIVRMERGLIIAETKHGFVCANAGVDLSNAEAGTAILLPENPDESAMRLRTELSKSLGAEIGVVISDTFGRAWREGLVNVALGVSGVAPLIDYRGTRDANGNLLTATVLAVADEIAAAAELVMGKSNRVPVAIVRGFMAPSREGSGRDLIRAAVKDLFR